MLCYTGCRLPCWVQAGHGKTVLSHCSFMSGVSFMVGAQAVVALLHDVVMAGPLPKDCTHDLLPTLPGVVNTQKLQLIFTEVYHCTRCVVPCSHCDLHESCARLRCIEGADGRVVVHAAHWPCMKRLVRSHDARLIIGTLVYSRQSEADVQSATQRTLCRRTRTAVCA